MTEQYFGQVNGETDRRISILSFPAFNKESDYEDIREYWFQILMFLSAGISGPFSSNSGIAKGIFFAHISGVTFSSYHQVLRDKESGYRIFPDPEQNRILIFCGSHFCIVQG